MTQSPDAGSGASCLSAQRGRSRARWAPAWIAATLLDSDMDWHYHATTPAAELCLQAYFTSRRSTRTGPTTVTMNTLLQRPILNKIMDAERAPSLSEFGSAIIWGPKSSVIRFDSERLARRRKYSALAGWEWVDKILQRFPALGNLKEHEHYQVHLLNPRPAASSVLLNPRPARRQHPWCC